MSSTRAFKIKTVAVFVLCMAGFTGRAKATSLRDLINADNGSSSTASCADLNSKITAAEAIINQSCNGNDSCLREVLKCDAADTSIANQALDGASINETCSSLVDQACPDNNAGTAQSYAQEKRDAGLTRKEAMEAKQNADDAFQKQQTAALQAQNEAAKQQIETRKEYRDKTQQLQRNEEDALDAEQQKKLAQFKEASQSLDNINKQYIEMRDALRKKADEISQGDFNWKALCRNEAYKQSAEVQKRMDAQMQAESDLVDKTNNASSQIFGLRYRRLNKKRQKIADKYNETLARCYRGEVSPGLEAKIAQDKSRLEYASLEKKDADLDQLYKSQQAAVNQQLTQLQSDSDQKIARLGTRLKQDLDNAQSDFNSNMQLLQQQQASAQQQAMQQQSSNLKKLEQADNDLQQATRDQALASNKYICSTKNGGNRTQSDVDANGKRAAARKVAEAKGLCFSRRTTYQSNGQSCVVDGDPGTIKLNQVCNLIERVSTSAATDGSGGSGDSGSGSNGGSGANGSGGGNNTNQ